MGINGTPEQQAQPDASGTPPVAPPPAPGLPTPLVYNAKDFPHVPAVLQEKWEAVVQYDLDHSTIAKHTYLEWRIFHRLAFSPWHARKEVMDDVVPADYRRTPTLFDDAVDHCCRVLGNNPLRDQIAPHLLRRKTTVADHPPPPDKPYFRNDIQRSLYLLYEAEVLRRVEKYTKEHHVAAGEEDPYRYDALQSLRNKANIEYKEGHEEKWVWLMRAGVRGRLTSRSARLAQKHTREGAEEPSQHTSLNQSYGEENESELGAVFGKIDDTHIHKIQTAEVMIKVLKLVEEMEKKKKPGSEKRLTYGKQEMMVFRAYCENMAAGGEKNNAELADEIGMETNKFGAVLSNVAKKIRADSWLSKEFTRLLADSSDEHGR